MEPIKCVAAGDSGVGKTSLISTLCTGHFLSDDDYKPSCPQMYEADVKVNDTTVRVSVWDTAADPAYDRLRPLSYPQTYFAVLNEILSDEHYVAPPKDVFLLCFSLNSQTSYQNIEQKWIPEVSYHRFGAPFLLVGTKLDIRDEDENALNKSTEKQSTCVSYNQGLTLANKLNIKYVECSAKTQKALNVVIDEAIEAVIADRKKVKGFRTRPKIFNSCVLY